MPWQRHVADVLGEVDDDGRFCYRLGIVSVPRQSGKTLAMGALMLHRAALIPRGRVYFTQQTRQDASDWLINELSPLTASFPGDALHLRRAAGSEHIEWLPTAALVRPFPPTPAGLHGKTSDLVALDECWSHDLVKGQQLDTAVTPTQATKPNAQVVKFSTAGDATSLWWLGTCEQGRAAVLAGRTEGVAFFDWSCPDDLDPCEPASWPLYHPAYGRTIGASAMHAALDLLGPSEFARSYGNQWVATRARVIPLDAWRRAQDAELELPEPGAIALAFDVAVDRSDAAIVAAWRRPDGTAALELADTRPGIGWLVDRLRELVDRWRPRAIGYDAAGPALDVADVCTRAGLTVEGLKAREYVAACAGLLDGIVTDPPVIRLRPHPALDAAAGSAAMRALVDSWCWSRRSSSASIASLTAATCALWAFDHAPADLGTFRVW